MICGLFLISVLSNHAENFFVLANKAEEGKMIQTIFLISLMFLLSFLAFNFTRKTIIPSFVAAILVGVASHSFLKPIIDEKEIDSGYFTTHNMPLNLFIDYIKSETKSKIIFIGIQPKSTKFGEGLSAEVQKAIDKLVESL